MKTIKIYDGEKEIFSGNCYVNTVIFKGRIYDEIKEISQNGIKFSLRLSNGKNEESGEWNKPTFADCVAFGDLAGKIKKSYSYKYYFGIQATGRAKCVGVCAQIGRAHV